MALTLAAFEQHLRTLAPGEPRFLLGISGGVDSVVLCDLLLRAGITPELAHVNYRLRGDESDGDQQFVERLAKRHKLVLHTRTCTPAETRQLRRGNLQEQARDLRYSWMESICAERGCRYLLVAHHGDDQAETILAHFLRGSGPAGLAGMSAREGKILRPLLPFSREEILVYARKHRLKWREDSTNRGTAYLRNALRNRVLPALENVNPGLTDTLRRLSPVYRETAQLVAERISTERRKHVRQNGEEWSVPVQWLQSFEYPHLLMWDLLEEFGFSSAQVDEVLSLTDSQTGRRVLSETHQVIHDRSALVIAPLRQGWDMSTLIEADTSSIDDPVEMWFTLQEADGSVPPDDASEAWLDADLLTFPLLLRPWKEGDRFRPLGMRGHQKISDFLIHQKVPLHEKDQVLVLLSGDEIAWVPGHRIAHTFRITENTGRIWRAGLR